MLQTWTKILPFFIIEWFSKKYCERHFINLSRDGREASTRSAVSPYLNAYFVVRKK